jgi:soluble lytic murein transglycosylase-like protein
MPPAPRPARAAPGARPTPATRIDAGLGQVNLGYHAQRYAQPCDLLDPYRNLAIAAEILREQHTPGEDWLLAIGRYHRPAGGEPAARYRRSVSRTCPRAGRAPNRRGPAARQETSAMTTSHRPRLRAARPLLAGLPLASVPPPRR